TKSHVRAGRSLCVALRHVKVRRNAPVTQASLTVAESLNIEVTFLIRESLTLTDSPPDILTVVTLVLSNEVVEGVRLLTVLLEDIDSGKRGLVNTGRHVLEGRSLNLGPVSAKIKQSHYTFLFSELLRRCLGVTAMPERQARHLRLCLLMSLGQYRLRFLRGQ